MFLSNIGYILVWYAVCGLIIKGFLVFYDLLNRPRFRDYRGDITTEVGYEEDGYGRIVQELDDQCLNLETPHVSTGAHEPHLNA